MNPKIAKIFTIFSDELRAVPIAPKLEHSASFGSSVVVAVAPGPGSPPATERNLTFPACGKAHSCYTNLSALPRDPGGARWARVVGELRSATFRKHLSIRHPAGCTVPGDSSAFRIQPVLKTASNKRKLALYAS